MQAVEYVDSGMLLGLNIKEGQETSSQKKNFSEYGTSATVALFLVEHQAVIYRIVIVDSAFASQKLSFV